MARTGKTRVVKRVHPQLTTSQKATRREKFVSLTNDINDTRASYMDEVQGLAKKHGRSERWTQRQLYLGGKIVHRQRAPNAWNGFVCQRLNDINEGLSCGDRWKLTEFVEDHKETLKHDYSKLTAAQKNAFVNQVMKKRVENQKIVCDNPKAVQRDMLASFAAMDQELFFSEKAEKFARAVLDLEPWRLALKLEAFVVSGLDSLCPENTTFDHLVSHLCVEGAMQGAYFSPIHIQYEEDNRGLTDLAMEENDEDEDEDEDEDKQKRRMLVEELIAFREMEQGY
ncbi:hypothetical protein EV424DRAFT_1349418 [Suillus variegatus]|nr:hypothetical protein EV424DRAFT_1349418 [Suillus variegatus]